MENYRQVAFLLFVGIALATIYALDNTRDVFAVNATEFLMRIQGLFNSSLSFSGSTTMPNITGHYSNDEFGIANIVFKDGWRGSLMPTQKGLLAITFVPELLDENMSKQAGGIIPQISLYVVDKANYENPIEGIPTAEEKKASMSPEELDNYKEYIASQSKQREVPVEQIEEEIKNMTTTTCSDLEESSTSVINGKMFDVSSKQCSTALGPFLHKTYLYEDNDRVYALSMHGIQPIGMIRAFANTFSAGANQSGNVSGNGSGTEFGNANTGSTTQAQIEEAIKKMGKPSLQNYLPSLDEIAKTIEIR